MSRSDPSVLGVFDADMCRSFGSQTLKEPFRSLSLGHCVAAAGSQVPWLDTSCSLSSQAASGDLLRYLGSWSGGIL